MTSEPWCRIRGRGRQSRLWAEPSTFPPVAVRRSSAVASRKHHGDLGRAALPVFAVAGYLAAVVGTPVSARAREMVLDPKGPIILDVRTQSEFLSGGLPGAMNLPNTAIKANITSVVADKSAPILLYCLSGRRSTQAGNILVGMGYQKVYNLSGGIIAWQRDGLPLKAGCRATNAVGLLACAPPQGRAGVR